MHTPSLYRIYGLPLFVQRFLVMSPFFSNLTTYLCSSEKWPSYHNDSIIHGINISQMTICGEHLGFYFNKSVSYLVYNIAARNARKAIHNYIFTK